MEQPTITWTANNETTFSPHGISYSRLTSSQDPAEARWCRLVKTTYCDPTGVERTWESAERQVRTCFFFAFSFSFFYSGFWAVVLFVTPCHAGRLRFALLSDLIPATHDSGDVWRWRHSSCLVLMYAPCISQSINQSISHCLRRRLWIQIPNWIVWFYSRLLIIGRLITSKKAKTALNGESPNALAERQTNNKEKNGPDKWERKEKKTSMNMEACLILSYSQ